MIGYNTGGTGWYRILQTETGRTSFNIISLYITNQWVYNGPMYLNIDIIFNVLTDEGTIEYKSYGNTSTITKVRLISTGEASTSIGYVDFYFNGYKYDDGGHDNWNFILYDKSYIVNQLLSDTEYIGKSDTLPEGERLVKLVQFET